MNGIIYWISLSQLCPHPPLPPPPHRAIHDAHVTACRYGGANGHKIGGISFPTFAVEDEDYEVNPLGVVAAQDTAPTGKKAVFMHGQIDKPQVAQRLKKAGEFLVRESKTKAGQFVLCLRLHAHAGKFSCCSSIDPIFSCLIKRTAEGYHLTGHQLHKSTVEELVWHYHERQIALTAPHCMIHPADAADAVVTGYEHKQELYEVFPGNEITYNVEQELGHGNFGIVCKGKVKGVAAAVKVVRIKPPKAGQPPLTPSDLKQKKEKGSLDMQKEIIVMQEVAKFGGHPNLIKLIAYDQNLAEPLLALEFCAGGTLLQLAKDSKPPAGEPHNQDWFNSLDRYAIEIARGMAYLEKNDFVHRDLACRNIWLDGNDVCKIADFGLARNVNGAEDEAYQMNKYMNQVSNPTAWKWTAPEGNEDDIYTIKSDVWSYGITLAEMCQYGDKPYKGPEFKKWSQKFTDHVNADGTKDMIRPFWPTLLKMVMTLCWELRPADRPTFAALAKTLSTSLAAGAGGGGGQGAVEPALSGHGGDGGGGAAAAGGAAVAHLAAAKPGGLMPWYVPKLSGGQASALLVKEPPGTFVARNSSTQGLQAISIHLGGGSVSHILCVKTKSAKSPTGWTVKLGQDGEHQFNSVRELVNYYITYPPANPQTGHALVFNPLYK